MEFFAHEEVRKFQDTFMTDVDQTLKNRKILFAQAPTGLGKTAAVLAPALQRAFDENLTVFFLTSRHTQHEIVIQTLLDIALKSGKNIQVMDLIGRKHMCIHNDAKSLSSVDFGEKCRALRKADECEFYSNLFSGKGLSPSAKEVIDSIKLKPSRVQAVIDSCEINDICPFFTSLMLGKTAKVVVGDYYHIFNNSVRDSVFEVSGKSLSKSIIIIDEAHNLPDRLRELSSAQLSSLSLSSAISECEKVDRKLSDFLRDLKAFIEDEGSSINDEEIIERDWFITNVEDLFEESVGELIIRLDNASEKVLKESSRSICSILSGFFALWIQQGKEFARLFSREFFKGNVYYKISVNCLDPSAVSKNILSQVHSAVLMSGTLEPLQMFADILGVPNAYLKSYPNPFPKKNRLTLVVPDTTTKFSRRSDDEFQRIADYCLSVVNPLPVNSAIFFPSYQILKKVHSLLRENSQRTLFVEDKGFSKDEKTEFIENFKSYSKKGGACLLGVVGGSFSEGYDFPGELLKIVMVVGIPLSVPDLYTKSLINYYDSLFGKGWDYGYIFPAITRVLQASGRTIRSSTDEGVIVLLDERYSWSKYLKSLPSDAVITKNPASLLCEFFSGLGEHNTVIQSK